MMTIEYTHETIENESGPNFYWRGAPDDYFTLFCDLHVLGKVYGQEIRLNDLPYLQVKGGYFVKARSSENGDKLVYVKGSEIEIDLDCAIWRSVLTLFLSVSFYESHNFVEFDDKELIEHGNFIVSSEAERTCFRE
ncbi:hypothetical protein HYR99_11270 [Candidatus Poribacteria bacterium]|nr:hypothetical protein [Candidatus Poribacteria bacterium]